MLFWHQMKIILVPWRNYGRWYSWSHCLVQQMVSIPLCKNVLNIGVNRQDIEEHIKPPTDSCNVPLTHYVETLTTTGSSNYDRTWRSEWFRCWWEATFSKNTSKLVNERSLLRFSISCLVEASWTGRKVDYELDEPLLPPIKRKEVDDGCYILTEVRVPKRLDHADDIELKLPEIANVTDVHRHTLHVVLRRNGSGRVRASDEDIRGLVDSRETLQSTELQVGRQKDERKRRRTRYGEWLTIYFACKVHSWLHILVKVMSMFHVIVIITRKL